jgi:hypothetical protein
MNPPYYMVFDVESVGLHGEGFAVGWVVVKKSGRIMGRGLFACHPDDADGPDDGREWVAANVPADILPDRGAYGPMYVRDEFWAAWEHWKSQGAVLVADCSWPVEARFLARCVDQSPKDRTWGGPYPLHELASFRLAAGLDPLGTNDRLPDELPAHNPLADARQSARLLIEALDAIEGRPR